MTATLLFGPLDLMDESGDFQILGLSTDNGTSWGNPDAVDVTLRSFLQHGDLVETETWNNRTLDLAVSCRAENDDDLATAELTLVRQLHRRNTLSYQSLTATVPTVFPVLTSTLIPTDNDFEENFRHEAIFTIRMTCAPFVRAAVLEHVAALASGGSTVTTIEDVTSGSTGWTGTINTVTDETLTVNTSGVLVSSVTAIAPGGGSTVETLEKTFSSQNTTTLKYIGIDWEVSSGWLNTAPSLSASGVELSRVADVPSPDTPSLTRTFYAVPSGTNAVTNLKATYGGIVTAGMPRTPGFRIKKLVRTDVIPSISPRQLIRGLTLKGVMPTTGSIHVSHASGLNDVHVFTYPTEGTAGYSPACRRFIQVAGTNDTARVSGARNDCTSAVPYHIPIAQLPRGNYAIGVIVNLSGQIPGRRQLVLNFQSWIGSTQVGNFLDSRLYDANDYYDFTVGGYQFLLLDTIELPRLRMTEDPAAYQRISFSCPYPGGPLIDELLLFNNTIGQRTQVACGSATNLWIDSPDLSNDGQPGLFIGNAADRSDAYSAFSLAEAIDVHDFDPVKGVSVFSITTGPSTPSSVAFDYFPNYWYRVAPA